ncbi:hypothetical protein BDB01DRAFT_835923 [Pilobolus umbonatus]|nr:hypothetical protein BDB01DRAFT_835923 [Pilobolus umbonatus]
MLFIVIFLLFLLSYVLWKGDTSIIEISFHIRDIIICIYNNYTYNANKECRAKKYLRRRRADKASKTYLYNLIVREIYHFQEGDSKYPNVSRVTVEKELDEFLENNQDSSLYEILERFFDE